MQASHNGLPAYLVPFAAFLSPEPYAVRIVYKSVGYLARIVGVVLLLWSQELYRPWHLALLSGGEQLASASVGIGIGFVGAVLVTSARNFLALGALAGLVRDERSPVVYLRSFKSDARLLDDWREAFSLFMGHASATYEWSLAKATAAIGPLVAIGKPGEKLPPSGAARLYVDNDHWQDVATRLVAVAKLVVLRVGRTPGFLWELRHVVEQCDPRKVVVFLPARDRDLAYAYLREQAADMLPSPLPLHPGGALFLAFGPHWEPRLIGAPATRFRALCRRLFLAPSTVLRNALVQVAEEDGNFVRARTIRRSLPLLFFCCLTANLIAFDYVTSIMANFDDRLSALRQIVWIMLDSNFYFTSFTIACVVFAVPSVMLFQRFGPRLWIAAMMLVTGLLCASLYFSTDFRFLLLVRFLLGMSLAGLLPAILSYVADLVTPAYRARSVAVLVLALTVYPPLQLLLGEAGLVMAQLVPAPRSISALLFGPVEAGYSGADALLDWQGIYILLAVSATALAIWAFFVIRDEFAAVAPLGAPNARRAPAAGSDKMPSLPPLLDGYAPALSFVWFGLILLAASLATAVSQAVYGLTLPFVGPSGANAPISFWTYAAPYAGGALALMLCAWQIDRSGERRWHAAGSLLLATSGIWIAALGTAPAIKYFGLLVTSAGMYAAALVVWLLLADRPPGAGRPIQIAIFVSLAAFLQELLWIFYPSFLHAGALVGSSAGLVAVVLVLTVCRARKAQAA